MNEGCATFVHHRIMTRLLDQGRLSHGQYLEFLHSHTNVVFQPHYDDRRYSGINPYALGYAMMEDICRIATTPEDEDREWFPDIAGRGDPLGVLRDAWANHRDESFIAQYLSPHLMRKLALFHLLDDDGDPEIRVDAIHDPARLQARPPRPRPAVRRRAHRSGHPGRGCGPDGRPQAHPHPPRARPADAGPGRCAQVLQQLADLWGYGVVLREVDCGHGRDPTRAPGDGAAGIAI
jgi:spore cortex formation protein SpoVR/YcgB (stage V sporulation)